MVVPGNDTFNVTLGTDTVPDLATGDILVVSNGATANATITSFDATFATRNDGAATLTTKSTGGVIDLENATVGTGTYTIKVGAGTDTITGSKGDDIIGVATTQGNADTLDGGLGDDTLKLSGGSHTFSDNNKLKNIENFSLSTFINS